MATVRTLDSDFPTKFKWEQELKAAGGFLHFEDRDLQYVVMLTSVRMRVLHRKSVEFFETTVENDMKREKGLAITGCFMDNFTLLTIDIKTDIDDDEPARPDTQGFAGVVIEKGVKNPLSASEPTYAHLAFTPGPPSDLNIALGDPDPRQGISEAYGALGGVILNNVLIPSRKAEHAGVDRRFRDLNAEGAQCGLPYVAINKFAKLVVAAVKPHGVKLSMTTVRDRLFIAGFQDAVFLDGGDSALLNLNGSWIVRPGPFKNRATTFGTKFFYATPP